MPVAVRLLLVPAVVGLLLAGAGLNATAIANASTPRVLLIDNDAPTPNQGIDARTGEWGFAPHHLVVMQGEPIVFDHPQGNFRPHNVVSISRAGSSAEPVLESGAKFSSGLTMDTWLRPGSSWTLDTGAVDPGHYSYYCSIHPWMVGNITVLPAP